MPRRKVQTEKRLAPLFGRRAAAQWSGDAALKGIFGQNYVLIVGTQTLGLGIVPTTRFSGIRRPGG